MKNLLLILFTQSLFTLQGSAQLSVSGASPQLLVDEVLTGQSIQISNVQYHGFEDAIGYFHANCYRMTFTTGVLMTTGSIYNAVGPNNDHSYGGANNFPGDSMMNHDFQSNFDAAILEFDFIPAGDSLVLEYIFASEEYQYINHGTELDGSSFDDGIGIFLNKVGEAPENIALVNGERISVANINHGYGVYPTHHNGEYYIDNGNGTEAPENTDSMYVQYNGMTVPIRTAVSVVPTESYHLKIVIADQGDRDYDSGLFLRAQSLSAAIMENDFEELFVISPNPVQENLQIQATLKQRCTLTISNLSGNVLSTHELQGQTSISFSDLPSGMYFLTITDGASHCVKKVVKS